MHRYNPPSPQGFGGAGGLSRRVRRIDKTGESDVTYDCYYNVAWQLLEVRRGGVVFGVKTSAWARTATAALANDADSQSVTPHGAGRQPAGGCARPGTCLPVRPRRGLWP